MMEAAGGGGVVSRGLFEPGPGSWILCESDVIRVCADTSESN